MEKNKIIIEPHFWVTDAGGYPKKIEVKRDIFRLLGEIKDFAPAWRKLKTGELIPHVIYGERVYAPLYILKSLKSGKVINLCQNRIIEDIEIGKERLHSVILSNKVCDDTFLYVIEDEKLCQLMYLPIPTEYRRLNQDSISATMEHLIKELLK